MIKLRLSKIEIILNTHPSIVIRNYGLWKNGFYFNIALGPKGFFFDHGNFFKD